MSNLSGILKKLKKLLNQPIPMVWVFLILVVAILFFWGYFSSNLILKNPRLPLTFNPKTFGYEYETFQTKTGDGILLEGWFVPSKKKSCTTILALHGWGTNRSDVLPSTIFLGQEYNLVYFDFRNHGNSGGNQTSLTCLEIRDLQAIVQYLKEKKSEFVQNMGIYGFSMGGAVAISGSSKIPEIKAIIAESSFTSYNRVVIRCAKIFYGIPSFALPWTLFFARQRLGFDPEECSPIYYVDKISPRPLLLIQGGSDVRVPVTEGQTLYEKAKEPKEIWIVPGADHGTIREKHSEEFHDKLLHFFHQWLKN